MYNIFFCKLDAVFYFSKVQKYLVSAVFCKPAWPLEALSFLKYTTLIEKIVKQRIFHHQTRRKRLIVWIYNRVTFNICLMRSFP